MRCDRCGAKIDGSNGTCPLCGAPCMPQAPQFPSRKPKVSRYMVPFTLFYLVAAVIATVVLAVINGLYAPKVHYWAIAVFALWFVYFTLRRTVLGEENIYYKMLGQTTAILILLAVIAEVLQQWIIYEWVMPVFYAACWLCDSIVSLCSLRRSRQYLSSLWLLNWLTIPLLINCFVRHLPWIPTVVSCGGGLVALLVLSCVRPKELWDQLRRTFDR